MRTATAKVKLLCGKKAVEVDALFDTGASRSVMSKDLAAELGGCLVDLPKDQRYELQTAKKGARIRITARASANAEVAGCSIPSAAFEVSPDLERRKLIVGRTHLDEWDIEFTPRGPVPRKCPVALELI